MRPRILIAEPLDFSPRAAALLREHADVELKATAADGFAAALSAYDAVWFRLAVRVTAELLGATPRARVLATPVTGIDHIDLAACAARGVKVVSLKGEVEFLKTIHPTAELTVGLMLSLLREIPRAAADVRAGHWQRDRFRGGEIANKTIGLVGVGRLGTMVSRLLRAFGARVIGFDPRSDFPDGVVDARAPTLDALLSACDVVSLHVAYGPETHHLINTAALARMKPGALLVNTSRGGVVDEAALLAALESGHLGGAALDVLDGEPAIDGTHPLVAAAQQRTNLLITPHIGGSTRESFEKTELFLAQKVLAQLGVTP